MDKNEINVVRDEQGNLIGNVLWVSGAVWRDDGSLVISVSDSDNGRMILHNEHQIKAVIETLQRALVKHGSDCT
jgi:hypothetical protein